MAGLGGARLGAARHDMADMAGPGWRVMANEARLGAVWSGWVRRGRLGTAWLGQASRGSTRQTG